MKASILVASLILFATQAFANTYTYDITGFGVVPANGNITTSCDNCVLNASDITAWNLAGFSSTVPGSTVLVTGNGFVATPTGIFFNFNPAAPTFNDALFSELPNPTPVLGSPNSVEYANASTGLSYGPTGEATVCNTQTCYGTLASSNVDLGPLVRSVAAPEIDPMTSGSALTLLLGALAVLRGRRRATAI